LLSRFKFDVLWMGLTFLDFLIVDPDTVAFLLGIMPQLKLAAAGGAVAAIPLLILIWRFDPWRCRRAVAAGGAILCAAGLSALSWAVPEEGWEPFQGVNHVSNFFRSGVTEIPGLFSQGFFDADAKATGRPALAGDEACRPQGTP